MIKAVTFDLDGVYFTSESFKKFKTNLPKKITDEEKVNWVLYKSPEIYEFKMGQMSEDDYWEFAKQELGIQISNEEIFRILRDSYEVNNEVVEFVRQVRASGLKTCICSNNFSTRIRELNNKFDFLKDFDVKVFSFEVEVMKPDKGIFEQLIKQSGVNAEEIVYSDDDASKLQGAQELGIKAFAYENFEQFSRRIDALISS